MPVRLRLRAGEIGILLAYCNFKTGAEANALRLPGAPETGGGFMVKALQDQMNFWR
jgi:hypothetical protein